MPELNHEKIKQRAAELRKYILDTYIKPDEFYKKGNEALSQSAQGFGKGVFFKGELLGYNPSEKGHWALGLLSSEIRKNVCAHGVASNVPLGLSAEQNKNFPLFALMQILATGEIKGDWAALEEPSELPVRVFDNAPFILLSNKGETLGEFDPIKGFTKLTNLRTILVNGQYETMVDDLKKRFPGVSFRTSEQINDAIFDKKNAPFKSFEDQIHEKIKLEMSGLNA